MNWIYRNIYIYRDVGMAMQRKEIQRYRNTGIEIEIVIL